MQEIEINERRYRTGQLNAFQQFHVFRKLLPVISGLGTAIPDGDMGSLWTSIGPASQALSEMTKEDSEFVLKSCLSVCSVWNGQGWSRVTSAAGDLMFDDIDLMVMMKLTFEVMKDNLSDFFNAPRPNDSDAGASILPYPSSG